MKFLIIQTAFIGDVILALPVAEKLKRFFPNAQVDFLLRKGNENLVISHPCITKVIVWNKSEKKILNLLKIIYAVRKSGYDVVINLHRFASSGFITACSGAREKIGFDKNPFSFCYTRKFKHQVGNGKHEVKRNLELITFLTDDSFQLPKLYPSPVDFEHVLPLKQKSFVCMAPGSVWFTKQLPESKWVELIKLFNKQTLIYLMGSDKEIRLCNSIINQVQEHQVVNLAGQLTLLQSAALMRDAQMNYVNDSATLHMASALNAPVTAFFCSTLPSFGFGPLSEKSVVIETAEKLSCRPCGLHGKKQCPENHFRCGFGIEIGTSLLPKA